MSMKKFLQTLFSNKEEQTAYVAKERLKIILAHERLNLHDDSSVTPTWLPELQKEVLDVVTKYIKIDRDALKINVERRDNIDLLEINVTLPDHKTST